MKAGPPQSVALPPRAETLPGAGSGADAACISGAAPNADLNTDSGREPAARDLDRPWRPARAHNRPSAAAAFVRPRLPRRGRAHGAPGQPRGAPTVAPARRSFTFRFLPSDAWARSSAKPGSAGESPRLGGCSRRTAPGRTPTPPPRHPRRRPSHLRGDNWRRGRPAAHSTLSDAVWQNLLRPTAGRETRQPGAEQRAAPPAVARRGAATSRGRPAHAPPQHFRFQTRSSFKVISVRPAGRRPPSRAPLLPSPLRRVTNKFPALCGATFPRAPRPPRPPARSLRAPGPLYDGHRLPTALPAPSPAHTKSEMPGGLGHAPHRRATAGSGKPSRGAPNTARATKARSPKGRAASSLTLVVISELVSTAASDMVGHAGDPMQWTKKNARVRGLWRKSCRSPQRRRKRAAKVAAASGEPDTGTMQRWLFRAASGELTRRQIL